MQVYWDVLLGATPVSAEKSRTEQRATLAGSLGVQASRIILGSPFGRNPIQASSCSPTQLYQNHRLKMFMFNFCVLFLN